MVQNPIRPRRFAPLDPAKQKEGDERAVLKGIVFDVDGTLCESALSCVEFGCLKSASSILDLESMVLLRAFGFHYFQLKMKSTCIMS
jgi:hypothetical protein